MQSHNPSEHAEEILRLDGEKFRIAKEASDAEIEGERLEGECRRSEAMLTELEEGKGSRPGSAQEQGVADKDV